MRPIPGCRQRGAIAWMAGNSVAANLLMAVFLVGGLIFASTITQEVFPDLSLDRVTVSVAYPGSTPEDVESGIVMAIEEAVRNVDGIKEISAAASEGGGTVVCEMLLGADAQQVYQDIKAEVDRITTFPEEAERPVVTMLTARREVLRLIVYGDVSEASLRAVAEQVRDELMATPDITLVDLSGIRAPEISVEVAPAALREHGLTLAQVAQRIGAYAIDLPGGGIKTAAGEVLVRVDERRNRAREFADIPIVTDRAGSRLLLGDLAAVHDGFEESDLSSLYNGKPAAALLVFRVENETPQQVSGAVRRYIAERGPGLPPGIGLAIVNDMAVIYQQRADLMLRNGYVGLVLVFVLLGLFLEPRLAFWVMMGIPISFLGAFVFMPLADITLNVISLFAFIIALGIVVDDAIVVGENIYEYRRRGLPLLEAAARGARDVAMPVTFSILTNIAAFAPLLFIPGIMGKVFGIIPAVVILTFVISLVESLLILPAHLAHATVKPNPGPFLRWQRRFSDWFVRMVETVYAPLLDRVLRWKYVFIAAAFALLVSVFAYVASGRMGLEMFPAVESDFAYVSFALPYGTPAAKTEAVGRRLLAAAQQVIAANGGDSLAVGTLFNLGTASMQSGPIAVGGGGGASHLGQIFVYLTPPEVRPVGTTEFVRQWRAAAGSIPGIDNITFASDLGGPGAGKALSVELSHRDMATLERACGELARRLGEYPTVKDADDGYQEGKRQVEFRLTPAGAALGFTPGDIGRQVRSAFYGAQALRQQRGRDEIRVMVRVPKHERESEYFLETMVLRSPGGQELSLGEAATAVAGRAYTTITRREQRRTLTVSADVDPRSKANEVITALQADLLPDLARRYPGITWSFEGQQADMRESMQAMLIGLGVGLLAIYALLAVPFKHYFQPMIIMVSIPFGIIGAVFGHLLMGYALSIMSMMGIVALSGVVVNDALVMIDYANRRRREEGMDAHDAICSAGTRRFRPIMLTTLTTFGGLAPMIFETSMQAKFLIPMALSLGYGILFSTAICLLIVPCLYLMLEDIIWLAGALRRRLFGAPTEDHPQAQ